MQRFDVFEILKKEGISHFNPLQKQALETRFIENTANLVISSPTGSGKTLIAELAALEMIKRGKKVVYTCPLRALASEHYKNFKKYEKLGVKIALSIGDFDSSDHWLERYNWICTSYEKLDSLMRHRANFIPGVGLLIADEIHLLDSDRGPILETIIMRFKHLFPKAQILALSATIPNAKEIADWLNAELVVSDYRPTKLIKGIFFNDELETTEGRIDISSDKDIPILKICEHTLRNDGEILIFTPTRKSAQATASHLKALVSKYTNREELKEIANAIENALELPTEQCKRLADCVLSGIAFHTAGLTHKQRTIIEDAFRERKIRAVASTPTLALGVNLPSEVVIMRSMKRYTIDGMEDISVREYLQCSGRAGRPKYGKDGISIIIAKDSIEKEEYWKKYVLGEPEFVHSQLGWEPVLRMQILASIAMGITPTKSKLNAFLMHSFYAHQFGEIDTVMNKIKPILDDLIDWEFVNPSETKLIATPLGKRVSELYIDPYSAHKIINALKSREMKEIGYLYMLVDTEEMKPYLHVRSKDESDLWNYAYDREDALGFDVVGIGFDDYNFLEKYKTALLFYDWINEKSENDILKEYNVAPGVLRVHLENLDWLAYSSCELARITKLEKHILIINKLKRRIAHGVQEELLPLVELKNIGRVRGRKLFRSGIRGIADLRKISLSDLSKIIGPNIALSIKKQLGEKIDYKEETQKILEIS